MGPNQIWGFPGSSAGKESTCNAGDPGSTPESGRAPGEGIGCTLQCSWTSLVAQLVKNPPAIQETWVWSLDWEDSLERQWLPTPVFWPGEFHGQFHRVTKSRTWLSNFHFQFLSPLTMSLMIVSPQNLYVEILSFSMMVLGDVAFGR